MKNTEDAKYRSEASYLAQQTLGQIWAAPTDPGAFATTTPTNISTLLPNGTQMVSVDTTADVSVVTVTITWQQPGKEQHQFSTTANIAGG